MLFSKLFFKEKKNKTTLEKNKSAYSWKQKIDILYPKNLQ